MLCVLTSRVSEARRGLRFSLGCVRYGRVGESAGARERVLSGEWCESAFVCARGAERAETGERLREPAERGANKRESGAGARTS